MLINNFIIWILKGLKEGAIPLLHPEFNKFRTREKDKEKEEFGGVRVKK